MLLPGDTTTLSALDSLFPLFAPEPAAVRPRTFASAASHADRSQACLFTIPLPRVARPPSVCACVPLSQKCCLVRTLPGRSPGRCQCISVLSPRSPPNWRKSSARARQLIVGCCWLPRGVPSSTLHLSTSYSTPVLPLPRVTSPGVIGVSVCMRDHCCSATITEADFPGTIERALQQ